MPNTQRRSSGRAVVTEFGRHLQSRGITSQALAGLVGYSQQAVRAWRTGVVPHQCTLRAIAAALDLGAARVKRMIETRITPN